MQDCNTSNMSYLLTNIFSFYHILGKVSRKRLLKEKPMKNLKLSVTCKIYYLLIASIYTIFSEQTSSSLFFKHNAALTPPYQVLIDTNFINFSIKNKLDLVKSMMDCLYAKCTPCVTDCVMAELEKLGPKYRMALKVARDSRFERLPCIHKGTYADDCLVERVTQHRCYIVATCDKGLKNRLRKIAGVPIMYIAQHKYTIEQLPEAYGVMF